jgi:hypothetical protein
LKRHQEDHSLHDTPIAEWLGLRSGPDYCCVPACVRGMALRYASCKFRQMRSAQPIKRTHAYTHGVELSPSLSAGVVEADLSKRTQFRYSACMARPDILAGRGQEFDERTQSCQIGKKSSAELSCDGVKFYQRTQSCQIGTNSEASPMHARGYPVRRPELLGASLQREQRSLSRQSWFNAIGLRRENLRKARQRRMQPLRSYLTSAVRPGSTSKPYPTPDGAILPPNFRNARDFDP